jgi:hypothetical protein
MTALSNDDHAHFITQAEFGLGFHMISALQTMGRKVSLWPVNNAQRELYEKLPVLTLNGDTDQFPGKNGDISNVFFIVNQSLSCNEKIPTELFSNELKRVALALEKNPQAKLFAVLPYNSNQEQTEEFFKLQKSATIFLSPNLFGFKDQALLDHYFSYAPYFNQIPKPLEAAYPLLFVREMATFILSALQIKNLSGKIICVESQTPSLVEWHLHFLEAFGIKAPQGLKKIFSSLIQQNKKTTFSLHQDKGNVFNLDFQNAKELFPMNMSSLKKSMQLIYLQYKNATPDSNTSHFTYRNLP